MKALLVNPQEGACVFGFQEARRLQGKKAGGPPLGLITAAALLPAQWSLRLVDTAIRNLTENDWQWADIVMLSGNYLHRPSVLDLIRQCRERRKPVVVGGPYASSLPEEIMDAGANFVVAGEGENTIPMFIDALSAGKTSGLFKNEQRPDLTTSPIPRFDLLVKEEYQHAQVQTSRGCPFNCEFCDIITLYGRAPRFKTPSQVIAELEALYRLGWRGPVFIADDNFIGHKQHAQETLREIIGWQNRRSEPFGFFTQASVNLGQDRELIDLMTAANFGNIFIGVESPDEEVLTLAQKKQNLRNPLAESLDTINRNGLPVMASFVLGFDGEKRGVGDRICALVEKTAVPVAIIGTLWALPNTAMWHRMKLEGRLLEQAPIPIDFMGGKFNFITSRPTPEIIDEFVEVWNYLYEPSRFLARAYRYYLSMRPTRKAMKKEAGLPDPTSSEAPKTPQSLSESLATVRVFCILVWLLGVRSPCRMQFWKQLIGILKKNPSRVRQYIIACAYGPDMFRVRNMLSAWRATGAEPWRL
jgi:radical SAM superfamily enzyme YgiQ (UPF0313 family)